MLPLLLYGDPHRAYPDQLAVNLLAPHVVRGCCSGFGVVIPPAEVHYAAFWITGVYVFAVLDDVHAVETGSPDQLDVNERRPGRPKFLSHKVAIAAHISKDMIGGCIDAPFPQCLHNAGPRWGSHPQIEVGHVRGDMAARSPECHAVSLFQSPG